MSNEEKLFQGHAATRRLFREYHSLAVNKGWWERPIYAEETDRVLSKIALITSELGEAVEEVRRGPGYADIYLAGHDNKPEGMVVELADVVIRCADLCEALGLDLAEAMRVKHEYNKTRPNRHGGKLA